MNTQVRIGSADFGTHNGQPVKLWTLAADTALGPMEIAVAEYGATLQRCVVPDARGTATDVALGHDDLAGYVEGQTFFGALAGRYGNRLRDSHVVIDGEPHDLVANEGAHCLHGGPRGFDKKVWQGGVLPDGDGLAFRLHSPDGDMGFPGNLTLDVAFRITGAGVLTIDMTAVTDRVTLCNPVQHGYWNLGGHASGTIRDQTARFAAEFYTPVDGDLLATGEVLSVTGTPFDFRVPKPIGRDLDGVSGDAGRGVYAGGGYDHNLVLGLPGADGLRDCVEVICPANGLGMRLRTTEPGVQFYTGGYLGAEVIGKGGHPYCANAGFTLETQKFPGSPQFAHFPQAVLRPDQTYHHRMLFSFFHAAQSA